MLALIGRRVLIAIPTLFLVSLFVFALQRALPGDPFLVIAGEERDPEVIARLRAIYRMDDPVVVQFFAWLGQVMQGDFGRSLRTGEPVLGLILQKLPVTLQLAIASILVAIAIGIPAGVLAARRKDTVVDYSTSALALSGLSIPNFWLGIMLILVVSVELQWLPASTDAFVWLRLYEQQARRPDGEHRARRRVLHEAGPAGHQYQRVVPRERATEARGDVLADAVADHRVGPNTPRPPQLGQRIFGGEQRGLRDRGLGQSLPGGLGIRLAGIEHGAQIDADLGLQHLCASVDDVAENRFGLVEPTGHVDVL